MSTIVSPKNYCVQLSSRPGINGEPKYEHFTHVEYPFPDTKSPSTKPTLLLRTKYISVDPALRCCMNDPSGFEYLPTWPIDGSGPAKGLGGIAEVVEVLGSTNPASAEPDAGTKYKPGDLVASSVGFPWQLYWTVDASLEGLVTLDNPLVLAKPSLVISCLGLIGLTALIGLQERAGLTAGPEAPPQTCVVSGAAGAVGSLAGQLARLLGAQRVVGICGTPEKCEVLTSELGFDAAICYRTQDVGQALPDKCSGGVDVYFDNVGGPITDAVLRQMNQDARVVLCGQISQYNKLSEYPAPLSPELNEIKVSKNISMDRFLVLRYPEKFDEALGLLGKWLAEGKLNVKETIVKGLENTGTAFVDMMNGKNIGKMIVEV